MPIRAECRHLYPKDWKAISLAIRAEAKQRCEWCSAVNGKPNPATGSRVILTVAHLDHDPTNNSRANLRALCQLCHNRHDAPVRAANRKNRRNGKENSNGKNT